MERPTHPAKRRSRHFGLSAGIVLLIGACVHAPRPPVTDLTSVHDTVRTGDIRSLKYRLKAGANPDMQDPASGRTLLMTALLAEQPKAFHLLLQAGADLEKTDNVGNTALHVAAQVNEPWRVLDLLKAGASPNARNAQAQTFERYLFMTSDKLLSKDAIKGRRAVVDWLNAHPARSGPPKSSAQLPPEPAIDLRTIGWRLSYALYWRITPDGKGEVSAPSALGHTTINEAGKSYRYVFKGGVHRFDIGREGYQELRILLGDVLTGTIGGLASQESLDGPSSATCNVGTVRDLPAIQLSWSGASTGSFILPEGCLTPLGKNVAERLNASWLVLARRMVNSGQAGVAKDDVPTLLPPAASRP